MIFTRTIWEKGKDITIMSYSQFHIDVCIKRDNSEAEWRLTGFYRNPETNRRGESWRLLKEIGSRNNLPWLCMRDFNEILHVDEKVGGREG